MLKLKHLKRSDIKKVFIVHRQIQKNTHHCKTNILRFTKNLKLDHTRNNRHIIRKKKIKNKKGGM